VILTFFSADLSLPVRWSYDADMFRRERPQKGRWRQFRQIGAEFFCGSSVEQRIAGDVELILLAKRVLSRVLGQEVFDKEIVLQINTLGDAESRVVFGIVLRKYLESKRGELSSEGDFSRFFFVVEKMGTRSGKTGSRSVVACFGCSARQTRCNRCSKHCGIVVGIVQSVKKAGLFVFAFA
jgi:histidyl-tRNA synthetase